MALAGQQNPETLWRWPPGWAPLGAGLELAMPPGSSGQKASTSSRWGRPGGPSHSGGGRKGAENP